MGYLSYFPDDERFIYWGEMPGSYKGEEASYLKDSTFKKKMDELIPQGKSIYGLVVMKGKELFPNPYHFPPKTSPHKPLLSKDGSVLLYEKSESGKFYLYSSDGNHRLVGSGGSANAAAISPDGELLAMIAFSLHIFKVQDGKRKIILYLPSAPKTITNWDEAYQRNKSLYRMIPERPSRILNQ